MTLSTGATMPATSGTDANAQMIIVQLKKKNIQ